MNRTLMALLATVALTMPAMAQKLGDNQDSRQLSRAQDSGDASRGPARSYRQQRTDRDYNRGRSADRDFDRGRRQASDRDFDRGRRMDRDYGRRADRDRDFDRGRRMDRDGYGRRAMNRNRGSEHR